MISKNIGPRAPRYGDTYYDTTDGQLRFYCTFCNEWIRVKGPPLVETALVEAGGHLYKVHAPT